MTGELCPSRRLTDTTSMPALIRAEAWQCLRLWNVTGGTPAIRLIALFHWTLTLFGLRVEPFSSQNIKASGPGLPKLAMAKGAVGDYYIADPTDHLNGLTARLIDLEADALPSGSDEHD